MANFNVTLPSARKSPVTDAEMIAKGFTHQFTVLASDLTSSGAVGATDTATVILGNTPTVWAVDKALGYVPTAFAGSGGLTVSAGTSTSAAAFIPALTVLTAGFLPMAAALPILTNASGTTSASLQLVFTNSVSGSISALTAGELRVYVNLIAPVQA